MIDHLHAKGVAAPCVRYLPNWVNIDGIVPAPAGAPNPFRAELAIPEGASVALYSGNMGAKQGLEILADAARQTRERDDLVWVLCGDGVGKAPLEAACAGLPNVRLLPLQPFARLNDLLNLADIHLLPQRADAADLVMPSKLGGMLASGRPVVATARGGTELATVVADCGIVVEPENAATFTAAVLELAAAPERRAALGKVARAYAEQHLGREGVLRAFETELQALVSEKAAR